MEKRVDVTEPVLRGSESSETEPDESGGFGGEPESGGVYEGRDGPHCKRRRLCDESTGVADGDDLAVQFLFALEQGS